MFHKKALTLLSISLLLSAPCHLQAGKRRKNISTKKAKVAQKRQYLLTRLAAQQKRDEEDLISKDMETARLWAKNNTVLCETIRSFEPANEDALAEIEHLDNVATQKALATEIILKMIAGKQKAAQPEGETSAAQDLACSVIGAEALQSSRIENIETPEVKIGWTTWFSDWWNGVGHNVTQELEQNQWDTQAIRKSEDLRNRINNAAQYYLASGSVEGLTQLYKSIKKSGLTGMNATLEQDTNKAIFLLLQEEQHKQQEAFGLSVTKCVETVRANINAGDQVSMAQALEAIDTLDDTLYATTELISALIATQNIARTAGMIEDVDFDELNRDSIYNTQRTIITYDTEKEGFKPNNYGTTRNLGYYMVSKLELEKEVHSLREVSEKLQATIHETKKSAQALNFMNIG